MRHFFPVGVRNTKVCKLLDQFFQTFEDMMFRYAKTNVALVNIYIDAPFATKIIVDEKVPTISFIAQVWKYIIALYTECFTPLKRQNWRLKKFKGLWVCNMFNRIHFNKFYSGSKNMELKIK
jgi:hypothetical protein